MYLDLRHSLGSLLNMKNCRRKLLVEILSLRLYTEKQDLKCQSGFDQRTVSHMLLHVQLGLWRLVRAYSMMISTKRLFSTSLRTTEQINLAKLKMLNVNSHIELEN